MQSAPTERSRVIELTPPVLYDAVGETTGAPRAIIRAKSLIFAAKLTTVPSDTSVFQWGIEMSVDKLLWLRVAQSTAVIDSQALPTVFTAKLNMQIAQAQLDSDSTVTNGNEFDIGMKYVRSWMNVSLFAGTSGFTLSFHQMT